MILCLNDILRYAEIYYYEEEYCSPDYFFSTDDYKIYRKEEAEELIEKENYLPDIFLPLFHINQFEVEKDYVYRNCGKKEIAEFDKMAREHRGTICFWMFEADPFFMPRIEKEIDRKALEAGMEWCKENHIRFSFSPIE